MPTLLLNRQCRVIDPESTSATVVCEPRANVSAGWCARIKPDPARPIGLWGRDYLEGTPDVRDGRAVIVFAGLLPGRYRPTRPCGPARPSPSTSRSPTAAGSRSSAAGATRAW